MLGCIWVLARPWISQKSLPGGSLARKLKVPVQLLRTACRKFDLKTQTIFLFLLGVSGFKYHCCCLNYQCELVLVHVLFFFNSFFFLEYHILLIPFKFCPSREELYARWKNSRMSLWLIPALPFDHYILPCIFYKLSFRNWRWIKKFYVKLSNHAN